MKTIKADKSNYGAKRSRDNVLYIVIHYTAGKGDTAEAEGRYFQGAGRKASAHFFIGQNGTVVKSVPLNYVAWSVGGAKYSDCAKTGGGKYYGIITNSNSVSIELCDNYTKDPSEAQIKAVKKTVKYIKKYCKNVKGIYRHFDVTGKYCPLRMMNDKVWKAFKEAIS